MLPLYLPCFLLVSGLLGAIHSITIQSSCDTGTPLGNWCFHNMGTTCYNHGYIYMLCIHFVKLELHFWYHFETKLLVFSWNLRTGSTQDARSELLSCWGRNRRNHQVSPSSTYQFTSKHRISGSALTNIACAVQPSAGKMKPMPWSFTEEFLQRSGASPTRTMAGTVRLVRLQGGAPKIAFSWCK